MSSSRIALVGASSPAGQALRMALEASSLTVRELRLLDPAPAGLLTSFRGEAMISTPLPEETSAVLEEISGMDVAFLCGEAADMGGIQALCALSGPPAVSLSPPGPDAPPGPCVFLPLNPDALAPGATLAYAPSAPACAASRLIAPLHAAVGVERTSVMVLVPVAAAGQQGLEALQDQAVAMLNMKDPPRDVFPIARAFNLLPLGPDPRIAREIEAVARLAPDSVVVAAAAVPTFHGWGVSLWADLQEALSGEAAGAILRASGLDPVALDEADTARAAAEGRMLTAVQQASGRRFWLWTAFESSTSGALSNALDLAGRFDGGAL